MRELGARIAGCLAVLLMLISVLTVLPTSNIARAEEDDLLYIEGTLYYDENGNTGFDPGEALMNIPITVDIWDIFENRSVASDTIVAGYFNLTVEPGRYEIRTGAYKDGTTVYFKTNSTPIILLDTPYQDYISVDKAEINAHLTVWLQGSDDPSLSGATVYLLDQDNDYRIESKGEVSQGNYTFDVYPGNFRVYASRTGYNSNSVAKTITITGNTTAQLGNADVYDSTNMTLTINGASMEQGTDYTVIPATGAITFTEPLTNHDKVSATYKYRKQSVELVAEATETRTNVSLAQAENHYEDNDTLVADAFPGATVGYLSYTPFDNATLKVYRGTTVTNKQETINATNTSIVNTERHINLLENITINRGGTPYLILKPQGYATTTYWSNITRKQKDYIDSVDFKNGVIYFKPFFAFNPATDEVFINYKYSYYVTYTDNYTIDETTGKVTLNQSLDDGEYLQAEYTWWDVVTSAVVVLPGGSLMDNTTEVVWNVTGAAPATTTYTATEYGGFSFAPALWPGDNLTVNYSYYPEIWKETTSKAPIDNASAAVSLNNVTAWTNGVEYTMYPQNKTIYFTDNLGPGDFIAVDYEYAASIQETIIADANGENAGLTLVKRTDRTITVAVTNITKDTPLYVVLYDQNTNTIAQGLTDTVLNPMSYDVVVPTYNGLFTLVLYPQGYVGQTIKDIDTVAGDYRHPATLSFVKSTVENAADTYITYDNVTTDSWKNFTLQRNLTFVANGYIDWVPTPNYRNVRMQIDNLVSGTPDGMLSYAEAQTFAEEWIEHRESRYISTQGFFEVNETAYEASHTLSDMNVNAWLVVPGLNGPGDQVSVEDDEPIYVMSEIDYSANISDGESEYRLDIYPVGGITYTVVLPPGYARDNEPFSQTVTADDRIEFTVTGTAFKTVRVKPIAGNEPTPEFDLVTGPEVHKLDNTTYLVKNHTAVTFDASASVANVGDIKTVKWTFGGGAETDWLTWDDENMTVDHWYNITTDGTYNVVLRVNDTADTVNQTSLTVYVDHDAPTPAIYSNLTQIKQGETIFFEGHNSTDGFTGYNLSYRWDFGDDSDDRISHEEAVNHTFFSSGTFEVTLTVTDLVGNEANVTKTIDVSDTTKPIANFTVSPSEDVAENTTITFNASTSYDPGNGTITNYSWDFDDDKVIDAYGEVVNFTYLNVGEYLCVLNVTDNAGNWETTSTAVNVHVGDRPDLTLVNISFSGELEAGSEVTIKVLIKNTGDAPLTEAATVTVKLDGPAGELIGTKQLSALDADGNITMEFAYTFAKSGNYTIYAEVSSPEEWANWIVDNNYTTTVEIAQAGWVPIVMVVLIVVGIVAFIALIAKRDAIADMMAERRLRSQEAKKAQRKKQKKEEKKEQKKE